MKFTSPVWSSARGALAGNVFRTSRFGGIQAGPRASYPRRNSPFQNIWRGALAAAAADWLSLSSPQRSAWGEWALTCSLHSGRLAFMRNIVFMRFWFAIGGAGNPRSLLAPLTAGQYLLRPDSITTNPLVGVGFRIRLYNPSPISARVIVCVAGPIPHTANTYRGSWWNNYKRSPSPVGPGYFNIDFDGLVDGARYAFRINGFEYLRGARRSATWESFHVAG